MKRTITNLRGMKERVSLPEEAWGGARNVDTGITLEFLYRGLKSGRMFATFNSIWASRNGECVGEYTNELNLTEWLEYCEVVGMEPEVEATEV